VSSDQSISQGYERVSSEDPQDGFISCDADNSVNVIDEVSYIVILVTNFL
jgi:hypothetical protein